MFQVQTRPTKHHDWVTTQPNITRAYARRIRDWYRNHVDYKKQPGFQVRVRPWRDQP